MIHGALYCQNPDCEDYLNAVGPFGLGREGFNDNEPGYDPTEMSYDRNSSPCSKKAA